MRFARVALRRLHFCKYWIVPFLTLAPLTAPGVAAPTTNVSPSDVRVFVDAAGRRITVPTHIERVYAAGPPAAIFLYTLAPERLIGWNRRLSPAEQALMPGRYAQLPALGRLTGRANTVNVEGVLKARAQLILDYGSLRQTYVSLADRVQAQTGIPYVLMDGSFKSIARAYRLLGELLDVRERAERLANYAERTQAEVEALLQKLPADRRPRVYYGRRPDGLETGLVRSINVEVLDLVGAVNVAAAGGERGGLTSVSMEQILMWNPEVVLTLEPQFFQSVFSDPLWHNVDAVKHHRVYLAPTLPFGWFDRPPSVNRLIGVKWLLAVLYPEYVFIDMRAQTREFYRLFYHLELDEQRLDQLLRHAVRTAQ